jgi:flavodoxin
MWLARILIARGSTEDAMKIQRPHNHAFWLGLALVCAASGCDRETAHEAKETTKAVAAEVKEEAKEAKAELDEHMPEMKAGLREARDNVKSGLQTANEKVKEGLRDVREELREDEPEPVAD